MPQIAALLVCACSSPHATAPPNAPVSPPSPPPSPSATSQTQEPTPEEVPPGDDPVTWTAHACKAMAWPEYNQDSTVADDVERRTWTLQMYDTNAHYEGRGNTMDDKVAAANATRPSGGVCDVRRRDSIESTILAMPSPKPTATRKAWDKKSALAYRDVVTTGLALSADEQARLARDGFVVPARLTYADYASAYSDIHRGQLPVFISVDSVLHAVYASHDQLLGRIEHQQLIARLDNALGAMHCGLAVASRDYPDEIAQDIDLYLTVARTLIAGNRVPSELGKVDKEAVKLVDIVNASSALVTIDLFGRPRALDATAFTPRGHYAGDPDLEKYFRAAMWLSRVEFNLVSRDCRSSQPGYDPVKGETPREAVVALALADLAERTKASVDLAAIERAWTAFAGRREDVPFADLLKLRASAKIAKLTDDDAAVKLRTAIGNNYQRTINVHPMPNVDHLPAIATMIGPRITPDAIALDVLTNGRGPDLRAPEVGYMLGHDRALSYIERDSAALTRLHTARTNLDHSPTGDDLYGAWLDAIRGLAQKPSGATPSFMDGDAFADLRLDSALVAYGQLRHNHVLVQAQGYDQGGCEIPDGYVEPALATYTALATYAQRGASIFKALDPKDASEGGKYFKRLARLMNVLAAISRDELADRPLTAEAKRFLAMVVEMREGTANGYNGSFPIATHDGWYLDLFPFQDVAFLDASFIADYATYNRDGNTGIHYLGGKGPQLGIFVVDTGGSPRVMVGPVARGYQHTGPLEMRLDDTTASTVDGTSPWSASYSLAAPAPPEVTLAFRRPPRSSKENLEIKGEPSEHELAPDVVRIDAQRDVGEVTVDLLDHHFVPMKTMKIRVGVGRTETPVVATPRPIESLAIHAGAFYGRLDLSLSGDGERTF